LPHARAAAAPHVHRHVVVVTARTHEHGLIAEFGGDVEAERARVEVAGRVDVAD